MIKVATLSKTFDHVSRMDEALDIPDGDLDEVFERWIDGKGDLPLKPNHQPTVFTFARPGPKVHAMIMDAETRGGTAEAVVTAVELTLREVKNLQGEGGADLDVDTYVDNKGIRRLSADALAVFSAVPELIYELGGRVLSELSVKKK